MRLPRRRLPVCTDSSSRVGRGRGSAMVCRITSSRGHRTTTRDSGVSTTTRRPSRPAPRRRPVDSALMQFTLESAPTLAAAEARVAALVRAARPGVMSRVNLLVGSNLQRLSLRRRIAADLGPTANVRFFTPIDLASAVRDRGPGVARQPLPDGADTLLVDGILQDLAAEGSLRRLQPGVSGVAEAVASSMTDLREAHLSSDAFARALRPGDDPKLHELAAIYRRYEAQMARFLDRTSPVRGRPRPAAARRRLRVGAGRRPADRCGHLRRAGRAVPVAAAGGRRERPARRAGARPAAAVVGVRGEPGLAVAGRGRDGAAAAVPATRRSRARSAPTSAPPAGRPRQRRSRAAC